MAEKLALLAAGSIVFKVVRDPSSATAASTARAAPLKTMQALGTKFTTVPVRAEAESGFEGRA